MAGVVSQDTVHVSEDTIRSVKVSLDRSRAYPPAMKKGAQIGCLFTVIQEKTANTDPWYVFRFASSLTVLLSNDHAIEHDVAIAVLDGCVPQRGSAVAPTRALVPAYPAAPVQPSQFVMNPNQGMGFTTREESMAHQNHMAQQQFVAHQQFMDR
jgi:hypothetical protein